MRHTTFRFQAMNTTIEAALPSEDARLEELESLIRDWFADTEARFSRFRQDSELSRLNRSAGALCLVSDAMLEVLLLAQSYRNATSGIFEPFVLPALKQAGYDRSFELLGPERLIEPPNQERRLTPDAVCINSAMRSVTFPRGAEIDLGGMVKSWAACRIAGYLRSTLGVDRGFVNAGGDLTVWNSKPGLQEACLVEIEHPWRADLTVGLLALDNGSAATSSTRGRRWKTSGGVMHHLIDPRSMRPSDSGVVQCTVCGPDAVACDIWAKTICVSGLEEGLPLFQRHAAGEYSLLAWTDSQASVFCGSRASLETHWRELPPDAEIITLHPHSPVYLKEEIRYD